MEREAIRMNLPRSGRWDVLVVGCGIAGLEAALHAAQAGCSVALLTSAKRFSGSSFYPGTWGLGLVGPEDAPDEDDLARTIQEVGCGMADPELVKAFVTGIRPAIAELRAMGAKLRRAEAREQREFIPCFDHKVRDWNGFEFDGARPALARKLEELGVEVLEDCEVVQLFRKAGRVCGAAAIRNGALIGLGCRALVLATGGYGSIFRYHLCTGDVTGLGQALALDAGCSLVNMEFMQMMPGYVSPAYGTVFNEKVFRYTRLSAGGAPLLPEGEQRLLEQRSGYGPFTSRLESREVDLALFRGFLADPQGVEAAYSEELLRDTPEFVQTYFDWLRREKGLTPADPIRIGVFAHAANGGVAIRTDGSTGVPGLFACGEVSGGMHGADRLGGLSTANALVFGGRAGRSAADACAAAPEPPERFRFQGWGCPNAAEALETLRELMFRNAMVIRSGTGLTDALARLDALESGLERAPSEQAGAIAQARQLEGRMTTARCVLRAALLRRESRGSHFREDFPQPDPELARPVFLRKDARGLRPWTPPGGQSPSGLPA